ncbi:TldD/PmbA family protein [Proteinivorax hydrogeniformans]|uniref:TldD/PmbA family protein n=1 Tax=Proteinivorax hydrogeniformans TaxID=1826727 RepID=A0AAU8HWC0_9FIRM
MNLNEFKQKLFEAGEKQGFKDMELYYQRTDSLNVKVFKGEVDNYSVSDSSGLSFRGTLNDKMGYSYTEKIDDSSIEMLVNEAKENAQVIEDKDVVEIFAGSPSYSEFEGYSKELEQLTAEKIIQFAKELEQEAYKLDDRVVSVNMCQVAKSEGEKLIANSKGLEKAAKDNLAYCVVSVVVKEGESVKSDMQFLGTKELKDFDAKKVAKEAVDKATSALGASSIKSKTYPTIIKNTTAANLLATFSSTFTAEAVQKGMSLLKGRIGDEVATSQVTIVDDPLYQKGLMSTPFDAEGVATYTKNVVENGKLNTFLHNLKTARKDGVKSTGNASKASYKGAVGIAPTNMFIKPQSKGYDEMVQSIEEGVIITSLQGLHSGANTVSGDFSLAAAGYLIENGEIKRPVDQITIAGNFFEVLKDIEEIGNDLEFGLPSNGYIGSPSLKIKGIAVSG